ncbi:MAG: protein translocase subunit SecDF [Bacteroidales bacterium]|nr:protein translocase subunit SecDF [Bacteroidales bacterium]
MQSKGAIKVFAIAFALVCLFQLSFTFFSTKVERNARKYARSEDAVRQAEKLAQGDAILKTFYLDSLFKARESYYLDSMTSEVVYNILVRKYTFKDVKERELNLGLDLRGGMNVVLEISVGDMIKALAGPNSVNPIFQQALQRAYDKQQATDRDFVTLFGESFEEIDPNARLASIFSTVELKDQISYNSTNDEVLSVIRKETESAFDRTFSILRTRIDRFGVTQPNVQKLAASNRILVELPGIKDPARVRKLLQGTAKLEFWETYNYDEIYNYFADANRRLVTIRGIDRLATVEDTGEMAETTEIAEDFLTEETEDTTALSLLDQLKADTLAPMAEDRSFEEYARENPLNALLMPAYFQGEDGNYYPGQTAVVGFAAIKDTAAINAMLRQVNSVFPRNLRLVWTIKPRDIKSDILELIAIKVTSRDETAALGGDVVVDARQDYDQFGNVEVSLSMNTEGARVWKRLTGENIGKQIAIVLDNHVYSFPVVRSEIAGGRSSISGGNMTLEEAQDLSNILKAGKMPAPARIVEEAVVGPSLGKEAINAGMWSFMLAFALVLLYMGFFYARAGWVADLALVINIFFIFGVLASLGAVLTLPGIAGIVLTLGMAVDANVIIYERIKEELRAGKGIRLAITDGYKAAYSAIIDGNLTTLLVAIVLYTFGTGPVQGFATTLIIGILSSLFTAIFISRMIFTWMLEKNHPLSFDYPVNRHFLQDPKINWLGLRKYAYIISVSLALIGIVSLAIRGLDQGIDFTGGRTYVVRFDQNIMTTDIRAALADEFEGMAPEVKTFGPSTQVKIATKYLIDDSSPEVDSIIQTKLYQGLKPFFIKQDLTYMDFSTDVAQTGKLLGILSSQTVGPTIAVDIRNKAAMAVTFALIIIFVYIAFRFKKWQYGLSGLIAVFHDALITIGAFSLLYSIMPFSMELDQAFIAAILTIIGYSINDTVVIFDRIREYVTLFPKREYRVNVNAALDSTLSRTVNTAGSTLVVLLAMFIFGGEVIRGFTFALFLGIFIGTYSSVFVATPVAFDLLTRRRSKTSHQKETK